jgi:hypothetical protein
MKKNAYPISSLVKFHTKKFADPQNDKKKIKDSGTSNMKAKKFQSSQEERQIPLVSLSKTSHNFLKPHKMIRRKIENFET